MRTRRSCRRLFFEGLEQRVLMVNDLDDSMSEATNLGAASATTPAVINDSISPDTDVDMYKFTVTKGQIVDMNIDTPQNGPGGLGSYLRLFDSSGNQIDSNNDGAAPGENTVGFDAYLRHTFAAAGTFYVGVSNANNITYDPKTGNGDTAGGSNSTGSYTLTVEALPVDNDSTLVKATSLGALSATAVTKNDSIVTDIDVDLYKFTVTAGQVGDFDIDTTANGPGGLGSYLRLFDSQGQQIDFNDNGAAPGENTVGFDAYLRHTFATGGTYYVGVSNANNITYDPTTGSGLTAGGLYSIGAYSLTVNLVTPPPTDNNDQISEAVNLGTVTTTPIVKDDSLAFDTDVNMYKFTVTANQVVDFDIDTTLNGTGGLGSYLRLFNSSGTQLAFNDDAAAPGENTVGFDAYLRFTFTTAGTYYIAVSNNNNIQYNPTTGNGDTSGGANATGAYELIVQALPIDTDDQMSEATALGSLTTTPVTKSDSIVTDIDVDMYSFSALAGQAIDFDIDTPANAPGGLDSYLRLFNAQGQQIDFNNNAVAPGENTVGLDAYVRHTFTTGGKYYVAVSNANNTQYDPSTGNGDTAGGQNSIGNYQLIVNLVSTAPVDTDDQISEAISLGSITTTPVSHTDSISVDTDVDMYRVTVTAGQVVDFNIDTPINGAGGLGSYIRLFNSQGTQLAFNDDANAPGENTIGFDSYLRFTFTTGGTFYLGVSNANNITYDPVSGNSDTTGGANATGSYTLTVQALPTDTDDQITEATALGALSSTVKSVSDSIITDIDVDVYSFTVLSSQIVDFDIDTTQNGTGGVDSYLRLFNAQGQQIDFDDNGAAPGESTVGFDAYLRHSFATGGTYYIAVSNNVNTQYDVTTGNGDTAGGFNTIGAYQLNLQVVSTTNPDPDDQISEATALGTLSITPTTVNASISPDTDVNMVSFTVTANQTVDFDIDTTQNGAGGLNSYLRLFDNTGLQLASNDNGNAPGETQLGFDAYLRYTFATAGTYYVAVSNNVNVNYSAVTGTGDIAGGTTGSYQLVVQLVASDPDDQISEATALGAATTTPIVRNDAISLDTDVDMYSFTVTANQVVDFDIDTTLNGPGGLGSYLRLFNAQGQQLAFNDDATAPGESTLGFDAYLRYTFTTAGTYYIAVSNNTNTQYDPIAGTGDTGGGQNATGSYTLTVLALPIDTNDQISEATALGVLSTAVTTINDSIVTDIDVNMYSFTVTAGQTIDFDIDTTTNGAGGLDSFLSIFNAQGQQLTFNDNAAAPGESVVGFDAYVRYKFTTAGTYYVAVSNLKNVLYDPITGNNDTPSGPNAIGSYQLNLQVIGTVTDPDDQISEATPLGTITTTPVTKSDSISPDTDVDMYSFAVSAGQIVDFDIDTAANGVGGVDSYLRLFNAQGQQLAFNNNATAPGEATLGFDAYLRFTFTTGGTYYIAVSNANNTLYDATTGSGDTAGGSNSTGAYSLTVQGVVLNPTLTVTSSATSIPEFNGTATGTVTRTNADTSQALVVTLASSNTAAATVPATVTIQAGQSSANFTITAVDDHVVDGTRSTTITASSNSFVNGTQLIQVTDSDGAWHNAAHPFDVDNNGSITPADALVIINYLNAFGSGPVPAGSPPPFYDVDSDNFITPSDALLVINAINAGASGEGESAAPAGVVSNSTTPSTLSPTLVDAVFAEQAMPTAKRRLY